MSGRLHLISLGCTKNLVDSEVMLGTLKNFEIIDNIENADVIIVNTCGFIDSAKQESINTILDVHSQRREDSLLVVTGCLTQRYQEELSKELPEVDVFTGVSEFHKIDELIRDRFSKFSDETFLQSNQKRVITGSSYHAYIKIAEGCNQSCSFCAIPSFKGKLKSRDLESITKEVKDLVNQGYFDFSFISQDTSSYLRDFDKKNGLIELISEIEKIDGVKSARILYLYPTTTSKKLIDKIKESKTFQNYFDIPIQHISDFMLKTMKRGLGENQLKELLNYIKDDNSFVRTSFIIGHPRESKSDFNSILEYLKEFGFDRVNIFSYSDEEGTTAYEMSEKIADEEIENRVDTIEELSSELILEKAKSYIGKELLAVIDGESDEHEYLLSARALIWAPDIDGEILVNDSEIENLDYQREIYKIKITDTAGDKLVGQVIK